MSSTENKPTIATGKVSLAGYELNIGAPEYLPSPDNGDPFLHVLPDGVLVAHHGSLDVGSYNSTDGGRSWKRGHWGLGVSIVNRRDGSVVAMDFLTYPAEGAATGPYDGRGRRLLPDYRDKTPPMHVKMHIPGAVPIVDDGGCYGAGPAFWRSIIEEEDGTLLATGYGCFEHNDEPPLGYPREWGMRRFESFVIESKDEGFTWHLRAVIAGDRETGQEGFDEPVMVDLGNGELLVVMRTGRASPLHQVRSLDHGHTWSQPESLHMTGLNPDLLVLNDGTLVLSSGTRTPDAQWDVTNIEDYQTRYVEGLGDPPLRQGGYIRFSRDGGRTYSEPLHLDDQVGQCYTTLAEPEQGRLLFAIRHNWRVNTPGDWMMGEGRNFVYPITYKALG